MTSCIAIPITDIRPNNKQDLFNLLSDIEKQHQHFKAVYCLFDSCGWDFVQYFVETFPWITPIWNNGKAFQFTKNSNEGLRRAFAADSGCWLVNQDCRLSNLWALFVAGEKSKGILSPTTTNECPEPLPPPMLEFQPTERFAFFCAYFSKEAMDKVGFMDEVYTKVFSDDDYIVRCHLAGIPVEVVNIPIYHKGSYIQPDKDGNFESASGCYTNDDLGFSLVQYQTKWNCQDVNHDNIIKSVLDRFQWSEEMKCN